jgi:hypothetical protein
MAATAVILWCHSGDMVVATAVIHAMAVVVMSVIGWKVDSSDMVDGCDTVAATCTCYGWQQHAMIKQQ